MRRSLGGGTLNGPYSKEEATGILGPNWVPIPQFGLEQGAKVRMIDDASLYLQNATVGGSFRLTLGGISWWLSPRFGFRRCARTGM